MIVPISGLRQFIALWNRIIEAGQDEFFTCCNAIAGDAGSFAQRNGDFYDRVMQAPAQSTRKGRF